MTARPSSQANVRVSCTPFGSVSVTTTLNDPGDPLAALPYPTVPEMTPLLEGVLSKVTAATSTSEGRQRERDHVAAGGNRHELTPAQRVGHG